MKRQVITLVSLLLISSSSGKSSNLPVLSSPDNLRRLFYSNNSDISFCMAYPEACTSFNISFFERKALYEKVISQQWKLDMTKVISIASPEIAMYSSALDKMETLASETFYVQLGEEYANFSLGIFQMKPSFIRTLEIAVKKESFEVKLPVDISLGQYDDEKSRRIRIQRLGDPVWQLHYLCAFYSLMEIKTKNKKFSTLNERLAYYATAYNAGFLKSEHEIEKLRHAKLFPRKLPGRTERFSYADVAEYMYNNFISKN